MYSAAVAEAKWSQNLLRKQNADAEACIAEARRKVSQKQRLISSHFNWNLDQNSYGIYWEVVWRYCLGVSLDSHRCKVASWFVYEERLDFLVMRNEHYLNIYRNSEPHAGWTDLEERVTILSMDPWIYENVRAAKDITSQERRVGTNMFKQFQSCW